MVCPHCRTETPLTTGRCIACSAELSAVDRGADDRRYHARPQSLARRDPRCRRAPRSGLGPGVLFAGRYRIERLLGVGGMGAVYKAEDQELGIPIALKVIRTEVLSNPGVGIDFERRFKQELLLARQVTHQNVLRIHDLGEANGVKYITMPFIEGSDLHAILGSGHLPFERVLSIARQITSGLAAAHDVGIVHRDLKPQNILVDLSGRAYISDFGLAKSYEASAAGLTRPGDFIGTPRYMAPESVEGQPTRSSKRPVRARVDPLRDGVGIDAVSRGLRARSADAARPDLAASAERGGARTPAVLHATSSCGAWRRSRQSPLSDGARTAAGSRAVEGAERHAEPLRPPSVVINVPLPDLAARVDRLPR